MSTTAAMTSWLGPFGRRRDPSRTLLLRGAMPARTRPVEYEVQNGYSRIAHVDEAGRSLFDARGADSDP
jgi:hypothetical protein